jgi:hypothetical protein
MRRIVLTALITCLAVGTAAAQSCESLLPPTVLLLPTAP